jgi:Uma2 family endonuclease
MKQMADPAIKLEDSFTYSQYKNWPEDQRWELIDGEAWAMAGASTRHQTLCLRLTLEIGAFLKGKPCQLFSAPYDVLFPKNDEDDDEVPSVVQPDLVVFCDRAKIRDANARGAPDLLVEILSPSTSKKDLNEKFRLYERNDVREYWVVDPWARTLCIYRPVAKGRFDRGELHEAPRDAEGAVAGKAARVESRVLERLVIDVEGLFADLD